MHTKYGRNSKKKKIKKNKSRGTNGGVNAFKNHLN